MLNTRVRVLGTANNAGSYPTTIVVSHPAGILVAVAVVVDVVVADNVQAPQCQTQRSIIVASGGVMISG